MEEMFEDTVSKDLLRRMMEIAMNLIVHAQQVNTLKVMFTMGMLSTTPEEFEKFCTDYANTIDVIASTLPTKNDSKVTMGDAMDFFFTIQDKIPMVMELDNRLKEMDANIVDTDGITLSDYLTEAIRVGYLTDRQGAAPSSGGFLVPKFFVILHVVVLHRRCKFAI